MSKETFSIWLRQGELYLSIGGVTKEEIDKMKEIRERDPQENWENRDMELLTKAMKELGIEPKKEE